MAARGREPSNSHLGAVPGRSIPLLGIQAKGPATDSHPQGLSRKRDPCSPPPAEQLSRDPLYSPGTRHGLQQLARPQAQLRASAGPSGEHSPGSPPQAQKWSSAKQRWSTGGHSNNPPSPPRVYLAEKPYPRITTTPGCCQHSCRSNSAFSAFWHAFPGCAA